MCDNLHRVYKDDSVFCNDLPHPRSCRNRQDFCDPWRPKGSFLIRASLYCNLLLNGCNIPGRVKTEQT
jgi:hypothetical protein